MLSGSAIVRVSVLLVVAGLLAALAQFLWLRGPGESAGEAPTVAAPPRERPVEPDPPSPAPEPEQPPVVRPPPVPPPVQAAPEVPPANREAAPVPAAPQDRAAPAPERTDPRAVALVDLNTATLAQLNGLKGGGNIGRAIIQKRPYASVDQLLAKRVLSRTTYERIKDQVTVQ